MEALTRSLGQADSSLEQLKARLTKAQARGLEQYYMLLYHTINIANPANNQINGISLKILS